MFGFLYFLYKLILFSVFFIGFIILITQLIYLKLKSRKNKIFGKDLKIVSFVHPFCADCGGGEKVLWRMITSLLNFKPNVQNQTKKIKINIISGQTINLKELKQKLQERFKINFNSNPNNSFVIDIEIITINVGFILKPQKIATMILQILGQILFAFYIITTIYSDVYCDTTGLPFSYFIFKIFGHSKVTSYTHYPFISNDMLNDIKKNVPGVHSRGIFGKIGFLKKIKILYYKFILWFYSFMGKFIDFSFTNSTWTFNHMKEIWKNNNISILYPPCSTEIYQECFSNNNRNNLIVSFAQFRPEKNQKMQIDIFNQIKPKFNNLELHILGAVRNEDDQKLFDGLQNYINSLNLSQSVKLIKNAPTSLVQEEFKKAKIGIHTMRDEHFGISIIEMMAAGLIVITHNSAGAKFDIIGPSKKPVGFLVENEEGFISQISEILNNYNSIGNNIKINALQQANKFSDSSFSENFLKEIDKII